MRAALVDGMAPAALTHMVDELAARFSVAPGATVADTLDRILATTIGGP